MADLTPNITGLLRRWGVAVGDIGAVEVTKLVQRFSNGEENVIVDLAGPLEMWQHPWQLVQASRLRQKLRDVVASNSSDAHPLTLHKSATLQVASADPETGRVLLADGTAIEADVVVAADGIHVSEILSWHCGVCADQTAHAVDGERGNWRKEHYPV